MSIRKSLSRFLLDFITMALLLGVPFGVILYENSKTYVVYQTPDHKVVKIFNSVGREVKPETVNLKKVKYEIVWVSPDYK